MFVVDLVTRSTTGSWKTSIRLSMVVKPLTEKLTCCVFLKWKHDAFNTTLKLYFSQLQIWRAKKPSNRNLTRRFERILFKIMLLKKHQKCKISRFRGIKWTKSWLFGLHAKFFQKLTCPNFFKSKSNALFLFHSIIWRFVKLFNQNLTRFEIFISKSDALEKLNSKFEKFWNSLLRNVSFILFFKFWLNEVIFCQR